MYIYIYTCVTCIREEEHRTDFRSPTKTYPQPQPQDLPKAQEDT